MIDRVSKILATLLLAVFAMTFATAQSANADAQANMFTEAVFYAGHPEADGEVLARFDAATAATADVEGATHLVLESAEQTLTFALATQAYAEGQLQLAVDLVEGGVDTGTSTYAEVVAQLNAAMQGDTELAVFTEGEADDGVVIAMARIGADTSDTTMAAQNATHVVLYVDGRAHVRAVVANGNTLAETRVESDEDDGSSVVEVAGTLGIDVDIDGDDANSEAESEAESETEVETDVEGGIDVDTDLDTDVESELETDGDAESEVEVEVETEVEAETEAETEAGDDSASDDTSDDESDEDSDDDSDDGAEVGVGVSVGVGVN